jgi:DNA-binding GntR family transcriptional regulator
MTRPSPARKQQGKAKALSRNAHGKSGSISDAIYEALWHDIVFCLIPPGQTLDELSLVARFNSSRTPLREALSRLVGEGLVVQHRNKGAYVAEIKIADLAAFFEALHLTQRAIARLAALRCTPADLERLGQAASDYANEAEGSDPLHALELDRLFHLELAACARNVHLEGLYRRLLADQIRITTINSGARREDAELIEQVRRSIAEHGELLAAVEARDAALAERLSGEHMRLIRKRVASLATGELDLSVSPEPVQGSTG